MLCATNSADRGLSNFFSPNYQAHNRACLTHLESLGLPLSNRRVLELGSGPGDHTEFYVRRQCRIVSVDARQDCLDMLRRRHPGVQTVLCDLNAPAPLRDLGSFEIIHCYGILYHLENPSQLLAYMGEACSGLAIVETCVLGDDTRRVDMVDEIVEDYTQSSTGRGCRPTREWVFEELGRSFPFVYCTRTQPDHPEFPVNWNDLGNVPPLIRSVFVASKQPLDLPTLSPRLLDIQERLDTGAYIAELESILAERLTVMQEREELTRRLHDEAEALRATADERLGEMQRKDAAMAELEGEADERLNEMHRKDAAIADLAANLELRNAELERATAEANALRATADERLNEMQLKEAVIQEFLSKAERESETLDRLSAEIGSLRSEDDRVRSEASRLESEVQQLTRDRDELGKRIRGLEAESLVAYLRRRWKK